MTLADIVLLTIGLALGAWEVYALQNKTPGDTISDRLRALIRLHPILAFIFLAFWIWFPLHLFEIVP